MAAQRASDIAYGVVRAMILDLELAPGAFLNEQSLADELGLGRMPVREALARLGNERFVTILSRRGIVVTPLALDDVLDIFEAREAIECGVAYIAATRASEEDLSRLRVLISKANSARETLDSDQYLLDDHAIHTFLVHMVNNSLLQDAADLLLLHSLRFWRLYWQKRTPTQDAMISHADLLNALETKDPELAEKAMRTHLQSSRQLVQLLF